MISISALVALCEAGIEAGSVLFEKWKNVNYSKEEKELLIAAEDKGMFYIISVAQVPGSWIRAGGKDFMDDSDNYIAAKYLEKFCTLCERGLIIHEGGQLFMLTGTGFEKARELNKKNS